MATAVSILRWVLCIALVGVALLYLNGLAFALWAAGGPPTDRPNYFLWRAWYCLGFVVAALTLAVACSALVRTVPTRRQLKVGFILSVLAFVAWAFPNAVHWLKVDTRLDSGRAWSYEYEGCK